MSPNTATKVTSRQRLTRGLSHTASGPVDVTRGVLGLGAGSVRTGVAHLRQRYRDSRLAQEVATAPERVARELTAALGVPPARGGEVLASLPQALQEARRPRRRFLRPLLVTGVATVLLAGGAAAALILRRSAPPDEVSPRPPSVDVHPKP